MVAYNYRMDGIQGAILRVKLRHLEKWTDLRRAHAARYRELLSPAIERFGEAPDRRHVYHIFGVLHDERDRLQAWLGEHSVQTGIHYPIPVHLQQAYAALGYGKGDFPVTERVASRELSLPMYPELCDDDIGRVAELVNQFR